MRNFSRDDRSGGRSSGGSRGGFGGGRSGGGRSGGRDSGGRGVSGFGGRATMHEATCDECGKFCEVPFKPSGDKPIFCSSCFQTKGDSDSRGGDRRDRGSDRGDRGDRGDRRDSRDRGGDRGDRFGGRDERPRFEEKRMYSAICDSCGSDCEVPFRPTGGKPLFCSNCFGKDNSGFEHKGSKGVDMEQLKEELKAEMKDQFDALSAKLDRISRMLSPIVAAKDLPASAVTAEPDENDEEEIVVKKTERKKAAAKKG